MDGQMQSRQRTRSADVLPPPPAPPDDLLRKLKRSMKPPVSFTSWKVRSPKNKLDQRSTPNGQSDLNKAASVPARKDRDAAVEVASQKANLTEPSEGVPQPSSPLASSAIGPAPSTPNLLTDPPRPSLQEEGTSGDCHDLFAQKTSGNTAPAHTDATLLQTEPTTLAAVARRHSNQDAIGLEADVSTVMADLDPPQNLVEKTQNDLDSFPGAMIPSPIHQSIQDNKEGSKLDEPSSKRAISRGKSPLEDFRNSGARSPDQLESQLPLKIGFSPNSTDMFDIESVGPKSPLHTAHQSSQVLQNRGFSDWMKLRTELPDPVPQQANAVYERLVAPFLHSTIKHTAGLRDQLQEKTAYELVMARNSPFSAYVPTIVIRCRNQERQKQIEKALHGKAMASLLQRHPFPTQVVVDPTLGYRLYSLRRKEEELHRNPGFPVELSLSPYTTSICGVRIVVPHDELDGEAIALMTLGGLILANDKPFGLTVAHHMMPMAGGGPSQRTQSVGSGSLRASRLTRRWMIY
ncbi:hypothetical protein H2199_003829 [Coniosporium tulheliwenetii]|uniref:Uncharacterized protein n=1 Tax=Coniosporium tulheliwenetii TaxID=3383036 RepID=A0ACC2Z869_9PEZI|nr:hypothetical protein H2199_003829 [Cladosporium sp. JES 115]